MSDQRPQSSSTVSTAPPEVKPKSLTQWVHQLVGLKRAQVRSRLRGNHLHILIESQPCPEAKTVLPLLMQAFASTSPTQFLGSDTAPIYRVVVYGRPPQQSAPSWTEAFYLTQPEGRSEPATGTPPVSSTGPAQDSSESMAGTSIVPTLQLARQGNSAAIARYLSHVFGAQGLAVRAKVEAPQPPASDLQPRLFVSCEAAYIPDPLLLAAPIAQRLRELELTQFRDAIVFAQVAGESRPEWALRVDLTPTQEILKDWGRWGDVQAITRLLDRLLLSQGTRASALLKESTLHLSCRSTESTPPDQQTTLATIVPLLESLTPQGIRAASIYGLSQKGDGSSELFPLWVHWLDLPAKHQDEGGHTTLELAQRGNLGAITFLLTRLLNPNLDDKLATGGIRVQVRQKGDLLHIMTDAPVCPAQQAIGTAVVKFLQPLEIAGITGVRVYGRRAGQKQPLWSYGVDFGSRNSLVPEVTPDFAATDIYVGDLLSPPGALVVRSDLPPDDWRSVLAGWLNSALVGVQRSLIQTHLFAPLESENSLPQPPQAKTAGNPGVALVWGVTGVLVVVLSDWLLGQSLQPVASSPDTPIVQGSPTVAPTPVPSPAATQPALPRLSLKKSRVGDETAFNATGFTGPGRPMVAAPTASQQPLSLPASPLQPKAAIATNTGSYPTFNSRQLDEKIALYKQYVQTWGAPDVLIIGSSRALRGIDPVALEQALSEQGYPKVKIFNFGINGATAQVVDLIVRQVLPQEALPRLILWADGARAFNSGRSDITYNGIVASAGYRTLLAGNPPIPGTMLAQTAPRAESPKSGNTTANAETAPTSDTYQGLEQGLNQQLGALSFLYSQRDRFKEQLRDRAVAVLSVPGWLVALGGKVTPNPLTDATSPAASASNSPASVLEGEGLIDQDGFLPLPNRFNPATYYQKYARVPGDYDSDYESFALEGIQADAMTALAQFSQERQIPLIFVNLPLTSDYLDPTRRRHEAAFQQRMLALTAELGVTYRDLGAAFLDQVDYFSDPSHLNRYGAYEVSQRLAKDVMIPWQQARR